MLLETAGLVLPVSLHFSQGFAAPFRAFRTPSLNFFPLLLFPLQIRGVTPAPTFPFGQILRRKKNKTKPPHIKQRSVKSLSLQASSSGWTFEGRVPWQIDCATDYFHLRSLVGCLLKCRFHQPVPDLNNGSLSASWRLTKKVLQEKMHLLKR